VGLARSLGLETVAEGVETHEQLEVLTTNGCTRVQGFLLGRPVPAAAVPTTFGGCELLRSAADGVPCGRASVADGYAAADLPGPRLGSPQGETGDDPGVGDAVG
jgi:predicted signal transduction protein with EAL and GGDEF domain